MLTHARLRDAVAARTGVPRSVVAHVLDTTYVVVREELLRQGEVTFRGLFRVVPSTRVYRPLGGKLPPVRRIFLTLRPVRTLRQALSAVQLPPG